MKAFLARKGVAVKLVSIAAALAPCFLALSASAQTPAGSVAVNPLRQAYFGDLHLHTSYSFDAYIMGNSRVDPDEAYRFARGETVDYLGQPGRRREPLDFLAVTDHSENMGVVNQLEDPNSAASRSNYLQPVKDILAAIRGPDGRPDLRRIALAPKEAVAAFKRFLQESFLPQHGPVELPDDLQASVRSAWQREIDFANRNYQ
ncbi:MAG TPA: DUF3604 domain-containing protein, partial [Steroidobacteraceae bacterium]|nr:DUF3604 domain-containing protein [Steroidobacteraceae bacterium]